VKNKSLGATEYEAEKIVSGSSSMHRHPAGENTTYRDQEKSAVKIWTARTRPTGRDRRRNETRNLTEASDSRGKLPTETKRERRLEADGTNIQNENLGVKNSTKPIQIQIQHKDTKEKRTAQSKYKKSIFHLSRI
jgi:hypothetical protein